MINKIECSLVVFALLLCGELCALAATLPTGTVKNVRLYNGPNGPGSCPTGFDAGVPGGITCYSATVSCPKIADIGVWWSVIDPTSPPKGTIVLHGGLNGNNPLNDGYPSSYVAQDFQIVQVVWRSAWEAAGSGYTPNIKNAACRPATFFRYIDTNYAAKEGIPMCLQGHSAGAAAIAYSLKDYGAGTYVDKAMMTAGPPLSDLQQACEVPNAPRVRVWPPGQFGTVYSSPALISPAWQPFFAQWMDNLSGTNDCNAGVPTTAAENQAWKQMSIVDGIAGEGTFFYPRSALTAWIEGPDSAGGHPSQNSPMCELYFRNFKSASQFAGGCYKAMGSYSYTGPCYAVNEVGGVPSSEDVWNGTNVNGDSRVSPFEAMINDMADPDVGCIRRH